MATHNLLKMKGSKDKTIGCMTNHSHADSSVDRNSSSANEIDPFISPNSRKNVTFLLVIAALLGVIGLLLGLLLDSRKNEKTTLEVFIRSELPDYSREAIAADENSPQSKVVEFLEQDPQLDSYRAYRRLQRFALAVFYYDLNQSRAWRNSSLWMSYSSECDWYSTRRNETCAPEDLLVALSLRDNILSGTIPAEIALLTNLKYLELSGNDIRGTIPREIDRISSMSRLILSDNDMTGTLPYELGGLNKLTHIDLSGNGFTGSIPDVMFSTRRDGRPTEDMEEGPRRDMEDGPRDTTKKGSLRRNMQERGAKDPLIEVVNFTNNRLTGSIPAGIGMSRSLQRLEFRGNNLNGTLPSSFSNLTRLEHFGTCISRILVRYLLLKRPRLTIVSTALLCSRHSGQFHLGGSSFNFLDVP
jgi:hypothetical protein